MSDATLVQIPVWGGLDETTDSIRTPGTRMRKAQNCVFPSTNTCTKRAGFVPMTLLTDNGATLATLKRVMNCGGTPVVTDGFYAYGFAPTNNRWINHGRVAPCIATRTPVTAGYTKSVSADPISAVFVYQMMAQDVADVGGYRLIIWTINGAVAQGSGHYAMVLDIASGEPIAVAKLLNSSIPAASNAPSLMVRAIGVNGIFVVAYQTATDIVFRSFTPSTRTWSAETTAFAATGGGFRFDMTPNTPASGGDFILAWHNSIANTVAIQRWNSNLTSATAVISVAAALTGTHAVAVRCVAGERCWVAYANLTNGACVVKVTTHNVTTLANLTGPFAALTPGFTAPGEAMVGLERLATTTCMVTFGGTTLGIQWALCTNTAAVQAFGYGFGEMASWTPTSKPFVAVNQQVYIFAIYEKLYAASHCLLELSQTSGTVSAMPAAVVAPRAAMNDWATGLKKHRTISIATPGDPTQTKYTTLCFAVNELGTIGLNLVTFDFAHPSLFQTVTLGNTSYICGGALITYDGQRTNEAGFITYTTGVGIVSTSTVGGGLGKNKYHYLQVYRYRNARGEITRSLPPTFGPTTADLTGSATATNTVTLNVTNLSYATLKQDLTSVGNPVAIELYRTAYVSGAEGNYYLCAVIPNQVGATTTQFIDALDDATLQTMPLLYTTGNVLECDSPPSIRFLCIHNQRLFGLGDEGRTIWYTTAYVEGEQPRWNDALKLSVPGGDGDLVALCSFEGRLFAFTTTAMFYFTGDGPTDSGAGETWSAPVRLPFGLGCTDPRAICVTPMGIVFNTMKGVYLYDRSGEVRWIGERIQRSLVSNPVISSIVLYESDGYVLITARSADSDGSPGTIFCWDFRHDCWSKWDITTDPGITGVRSAATINGAYYVTVADGAGISSIAKYTPGTYRDATAAVWITWSVATGWISQADLQSEGRIARIQLIGQWQDRHDLQIDKNIDYGPLDSSSFFSYSVLESIPLEQLRTGLVRQKVQSVSVTITDVDHGNSGRSINLEGLLFKIRPRRGEYKRLSNAQSG